MSWESYTQSYTGNSDSMIVRHTHFALLYLRGGLCWDWGLACRRSTAIFTSENKSIQTLNTTVTCKSAYAFTQNGVAAPTLPWSKWKWAPISKLENPNWTSQNAANRVAKSVELILRWKRNEEILFSPSKLPSTSRAWTCKLDFQLEIWPPETQNHKCPPLVAFKSM